MYRFSSWNPSKYPVNLNYCLRHSLLLLLVLVCSLLKGSGEIFAQTQPTEEELPKSQVPEKVTVNNIFIVGNEKTRRRIILREMDLSIGVTYAWEDFIALLAADRKKIYNLLLFNTVELTPLFTSEDQVELLLTVKERWYIIPSLIFTLADRNFSEWWINQNRDFSRVNYGVKLDHNNVGGRNEKFRMIGQLGFTQALDLQYTKPYIDRKQRHGLGTRFTYFTNKTIGVRSGNNRQFFYTSEDEDILRRVINASLTYTYRGSYYNFHNVTLGYQNNKIHEDVLLQNPLYFPDSKTQIQYFVASYSYRHDKRDNIAYATEGQLLNLGLTQYGLLGGDDIRETEISVVANKYTRFGNKIHFVSGVSASTFLSKRQPYTLVRGIGYKPDFIRGYEINVIEGQQTIVHKNSLRYELLNLSFDISAFMPIEEFAVFPFRAYLSANFDHGYVNDKNRIPENLRLTNKYLYGYGLGLDLVSLYDLVFRFEYSINNQGTGNFFINVRSPL